MNFSFATAGEIIFGAGCFVKLGELARVYGDRVMLVAGAGKARPERAIDLLQDAGMSVEVFAVDREPDLELVQIATLLARRQKCKCVVGFGGGSVLDTAKAVSAMLANPGDLLDYLEVVGKGKPLTEKAMPCIAIPTTAGTGTEVTRNAVIQVPVQRVKVSLRSSLMIPAVALVDPELTISMPPAVTASTGMDALTQVLEPYVSGAANWMTDLFCLEGLRSASQSLLPAFLQGDDIVARSRMSWTSLLGGLALANGKLGAVHGFAGPLGGMFEAPHGAVCARLLPVVVRMNIQALAEREPENPSLARYVIVSQMLTGDKEATLEDGIGWLEQLCRDLHIPGLSAYGLTTVDLAAVVGKARHASSMKGNPIELTESEMFEILEEAL